jgi:hypothetical protein
LRLAEQRRSVLDEVVGDLDARCGELQQSIRALQSKHERNSAEIVNALNGKVGHSLVE